MSDVRDELVHLVCARKGVTNGEIADAILERWDLTPKPEPPVISDGDLGVLAAIAHDESPEYKLAGERLRRDLSQRGWEIVRKAETE